MTCCPQQFPRTTCETRSRQGSALQLDSRQPFTCSPDHPPTSIQSERTLLNLVSLDQAALLLLHFTQKLPDPHAADVLMKVVEDKELQKQFMRVKWFLQNAIDAEELPAIARAISKPEERKMLDAVNVPEDVRKNFPRQYKYWITFSDLRAFVERPDHVSPTAYAHSRQAIARVAWMLATTTGKEKDPESLFAYLEQMAEELSERGVPTNLGETTLRGCIREIMAAGEDLRGATD